MRDLWIYTDADNTLWDTDAVYAKAQLTLFSAAEALVGKNGPAIERLKFVREYDQEIATGHHARLRYPAALLLRALMQGIEGASPQEAARRVLATGSVPTERETPALNVHAQMLSSLPPLLSGVEEGLELARDAGIPVFVVSEGPLELTRNRLREHRIDQLTTGVLSAVKSMDLYARLMQRAAPRRALMIGDQPDRDIQLAHSAGMLTILIKGRFRPVWTESTGSMGADAEVGNFLQAIKLILEPGFPEPGSLG